MRNRQTSSRGLCGRNCSKHMTSSTTDSVTGVVIKNMRHSMQNTAKLDSRTGTDTKSWQSPEAMRQTEGMRMALKVF